LVPYIFGAQLMFSFDVWSELSVSVCGELQQKMRTSTAEALSRLDVVGAVRDHRRFNYVCKVTIILWTNIISASLCFSRL